MSKKCYITVRDEVYCHISGLEPQDHDYLENKYALMVEGARFMPLFRLGRWDGKVRFFEATGKVFLRLLPEIVPYLEQWGYEIELNDHRLPVKAVETRIDENWFIRPEIAVKAVLRPYQVEAVNACLENQCGFIEAATGAGKTLMVAALCDVLAQNEIRSIVIVPSDDLVKQTLATFNLVQIDTGVYSGAKKDIYHSTVIATWQALQNHPQLMSDFQAVIVDECHGLKARVVGDLVNNHGRNIAYRFGFTGTMPKPEIDRTTLKGSVGEVLYQVTAAFLIEQGFLANLEIEPIEIVDVVDEDFPDYASEKAFVSKNPDRLDLLADLIITKADKFGNTLVLVNSVKQGKELQKLIKDSVFLYGADDTDVRAEWYSSFENRDDLIVIATYGIASTGISIDRIFCLFMIDAGKSFQRTIQSCGRGLRKGHDKDFVHVVDAHSSLKWGRKHWRERQRYYKEAKYPILKVVKIQA